LSLLPEQRTPARSPPEAAVLRTAGKDGRTETRKQKQTQKQKQKE